MSSHLPTPEQVAARLRELGLLDAPRTPKRKSTASARPPRQSRETRWKSACQAGDLDALTTLQQEYAEWYHDLSPALQQSGNGQLLANLLAATLTRTPLEQLAELPHPYPVKATPPRSTTAPV